jgi:hypothetical protein
VVRGEGGGDLGGEPRRVGLRSRVHRGGDLELRLDARLHGQADHAVRVAEHRDAGPARQRLVRDEGGGVHQRAERGHRDDPGLGVERRAGLARRLLGIDGEQRDEPGQAARGVRELARVAEGLDVQQAELRVGVLLPVQQQVVRAHVVLLADRREGAHPDAEPVEVAQQREADAPGLHGHARGSRFGRGRRQQGAESVGSVRRGDAEAARTDEAHPGRAADFQQVEALLAVEAGRRHDQRPDSALGAAARGGDSP